MIARRSPFKELVLLCAVVTGLLFAWSAPASAQRMHEFSKSFGSEGSGNGEFIQPGVLAVNDSTGDVYVADRGNKRVEVFSEEGEYVTQFNGSASPTGVFAWSSTSFYAGIEGAIAVDNSISPLDPSKSDVYVLDTDHNVIDKFSSLGAYIGQISFPASPNGGHSLNGIAVASDGSLWAQYGESSETTIYKFNDNAPVNELGSTIKAKTRGRGGATGDFGDIGIALDSQDNLYIGLTQSEIAPSFPMELSPTGQVLAETLDGDEEGAIGIATDLSSNDVYVDDKTSIAAYSPSHDPIERFGSAQLATSEGVAVDSAKGTVYATDASNQNIDVFTAVVVPDVSTVAASNLAETSATVNGVVNPDGLPVTSCVFEYGTGAAYGQSVPCTQTPSGSSSVAVSADLTGLQPFTKYHFRLNVANENGSNQGLDQTFITPEPVVIAEESVSDVSSASAQFNAQVNPGGANTTYHFEYGLDTSYGESLPVPAGELGPQTSSEPVSVSAQGLLADTTYHVRLVASNLLSTRYGPDVTFTTQAGAGAFSLPDGRKWELVSPPDKGGALIDAIGGGAGFAGPIQASTDGGAITYYANGPIGANTAGNPNPQGETQILSRRGADGWSTEDITLPNSVALAGHFGHEYQFFTQNLSQALVEPLSETRLSPDATEYTPYLHDDSSGSYVPLVTAANVTPPGTAFGSQGAEPHVIAATPDLAHVIFMTPLALTAKAISKGETNIYEWAGGKFQLVNEPPVGSPFVREVVFGGQNDTNTRGALSRDGSRVFFQGKPEGAEDTLYVYMRDTVTEQTIAVSAPASGVSPPPTNEAHFQAASADGSHVFFTDDQPLTAGSKLKQVPPQSQGPEDLYVYNTEAGTLMDLSVDQNVGEEAEVQGKVVGMNEGGTIVYFVATGKLAAGAQAGADNLYVASATDSTWSAPRLVAVLSHEDANDWVGSTYGIEGLAARLSPDGGYLTFMSDQSLTGYENRDASSGEPDEEVFLYNESAGSLTCVSCNPTGARPQGVREPAQINGSPRLVDERHVWPERWVAATVPGWTPVENDIAREIFYPSRVLTDGGRIFFDSSDALVPQDTNGKEDVYEYEPQGVGSCTSAGGCVSLISSGTSGEESVFLDASATGAGGEEGEDVFFLSASRLASEDVDNSLDVYDAHECSPAAPCLTAPVSPPPCTSGDSCKLAPSLQPAIFGAPPSATFMGAGNVSANSSLTVKPKSKSRPTKCRKGFVKKKRQCFKKHKTKKKAKRSNGRGK
jgi:hypothetical protein